MNATFSKALRYFVDVECLSPLRTGGSANDTRTVLTDFYLVPFVQGTSLAGAFRNWLDDPELFSGTDLRSPLFFSDLQFENAEPVVRPRVRIDRDTGTNSGSAKFDLAALPAGTRGSFRLTWTGDQDPAEIAQRIEQYLAALNSGEIILGAQKSNGFGRVAVTVRRRIYHMNDRSDLNAWLLGEQVSDARLIELPDRVDPCVLFTVTTMLPAILVKSTGTKRGKNRGGRGKESGSIFTQIHEAGRRLVPGSSLKGSIHGHMERICTAFGYDPKEIKNLFGHENRKGSEGGRAGVLRFSDGILTDDKTVRIPRIRINRLTGGVVGTGKFTDEPVRANMTFEIRVPADRKAGCALLLYALRDLGLGLYELGSGSSVGRGRLSDTRITITHNGCKAELYCAPNRIELTDDDGLVAAWEQELRKGASL